MNCNTYTDMRKLIDSMEDTIRKQNRANAERRARKAVREQEEFEEKLMRAAICKAELEGLAAKAKGSESAVLRDQLLNLI